MKKQAKQREMHSKTKTAAVALAFILGAGSSLLAQQKGQYVPGQAGLNAGLIPDPGFAYGNMTLNYSASQLNNSSANAVLGISGTYGFWANENFFSYVPHFKVLGGHFAPLVILPFANGSLTAAGPLGIAPFGINAGGAGLADIWVQPINIGWHFSRVDFSAGDGFVAPTGRYSSAPGTTNNVGSGYWGNDVTTGTTIYLTKNKGTTANLFTDWEVHGQKQGTNFTPGQTFTDEWGIGQVFPLGRQGHTFFQVGVVGYDQWQVSGNGGTTQLGIPGRLVPFYSSHAIGVQSNLIVPAKGLYFYSKYEPEYLARSTTQGRTFVFGGSWNLRFPKEQSPKP